MQSTMQPIYLADLVFYVFSRHTNSAHGLYALLKERYLNQKKSEKMSSIVQQILILDRFFNFLCSPFHSCVKNLNSFLRRRCFVAVELRHACTGISRWSEEECSGANKRALLGRKLEIMLSAGHEHDRHSYMKIRIISIRETWAATHSCWKKNRQFRASLGCRESRVYIAVDIGWRSERRRRSQPAARRKRRSSSRARGEQAENALQYLARKRRREFV